MKQHSRMDREARTIGAMVGMYCRNQHSSSQLCQDCQELLSYAQERLRKCVFQEGKTTCAKCPIHCYQPAMREKIRAVMRWAGPKMIYRHPSMALQHLIDGRRKKPVT